MCLAKVYRNSKGSDNLISEYISKIKVDDSSVLLTDIMNNTTSIEGTLGEIDLESNTIIILPVK